MKTAFIFLWMMLFLFLFHTESMTQSSFTVSNKTSGDTLLSIQENGDLGIRVPLPGARLDVGMYNSGFWQRGIRLLNPALENGNQLLLTIGRSDDVNNAGNLYFTYDDDASELNRLSLGLYAVNDVLNILANGRVGIGTTNPSANLEMRGTDPDDGITFSIGNSDLSHQILMFPGRENDPNPFIRWKAGDPLRFSTDEGGWSEKMRIDAGGNVGIGTDSPGQLLEVAGTIRSTSGGFMFPDGSLQTTAISAGSDGNTLDEAYDQGDAGAGRTITADAGAVTIAGDDGLLSTGIYGSGDIPAEGAGVRMMWYPAKGAFRTGRVTGATYWDHDDIGDYSLSSGYNTRASGAHSMALGSFAEANGSYATALGRETISDSYASTAMGWGTTASGYYATSLGRETIASGYNSVAMGREIEANGDFTVAIALSDQNGLSVTQDNTMAIIGGNVGIGLTDPDQELVVAGIIRSSTGGFQFPDGTVQETSATGGALSINDLTDGKTGGYSVFLGPGAGENDDGVENYNTALGTDALNLTTTGTNNTAVGFSALVSNSGGIGNSALGYWALYANTTGERNVGIGQGANMRNQTGSNNTAVGYAAGAGTALHNKSGNVFVGYRAGFLETGDNKLYIENSDSDTPLIGGDFATDQVDLNGEVYVRNRLGIGTTTPGAGMHVVGNNFPNSFLYLESETGGDAGIRFYEESTAKWHIFNNATLDGLQIYNTQHAQNVIFAEQSTGHVGIGTTNPNSLLTVAGTAECDVLEINGGSDIAEPFDINDTGGIKAGMVMTIDAAHPGKLKLCEKAYDRCVAGIISGAGGINPGMIMGQSGTVADGEFPVALTGRVYCWADASSGRIQPGDLLTTSDIPGHAMRVVDYERAQGAVIGKAMSALESGQGLILVLVSLQ